MIIHIIIEMGKMLSKFYDCSHLSTSGDPHNCLIANMSRRYLWASRTIMNSLDGSDTLTDIFGGRVEDNVDFATGILLGFDGAQINMSVASPAVRNGWLVGNQCLKRRR